jgi:hypothetical protein
MLRDLQSNADIEVPSHVGHRNSQNQRDSIRKSTRDLTPYAPAYSQVVDGAPTLKKKRGMTVPETENPPLLQTKSAPGVLERHIIAPGILQTSRAPGNQEQGHLGVREVTGYDAGLHHRTGSTTEQIGCTITCN